MDLKINQKELLEHTLGGSDPEKWYRNYFSACPSHSDLPDLEELEKNGLMRRIETPRFMMEKDIVFTVTDAGKKFLKDLYSKNVMKCPRCGSPEIQTKTPRTVYQCGSSDYDQRPDTFSQTEHCGCLEVERDTKLNVENQ